MLRLFFFLLLLSFERPSFNYFLYPFPDCCLCPTTFSPVLLTMVFSFWPRWSLKKSLGSRDDQPDAVAWCWIFLHSEIVLWKRPRVCWRFTYTPWLCVDTVRKSSIEKKGSRNLLSRFLSFAIFSEIGWSDSKPVKLAVVINKLHFLWKRKKKNCLVSFSPSVFIVM